MAAIAQPAALAGNVPSDTDPDPTVFDVQLTGDFAQVKFELDGAETVQDVLGGLSLGPNSSWQVNGNTLVVDVGDPTVTVTPLAPDPSSAPADHRILARGSVAAAVAGPATLPDPDNPPPNPDSGGYTTILCDRQYGFGDAIGNYTIQRACNVRSAPWGYKFTTAVQALSANGEASETPGMQWWKNNAKQPNNSPHPNFPISYHWHGTYSGVGAGQTLDYYDTWFWTDDDANPGGAYIQGHLFIAGPTG